MTDKQVVTPEDEFDNAWDETSEEEPEAGTAAETELAPESVADDGEQAGNEERDPVPPEDSAAEREKQELKTWQGRNRKAQEEYEALEAKIEAQRKALEEMERQGSQEHESVEQDELDSLSEFQEIADPILEKVARDISDRLAPLEQQQQQTREEMQRAAQEQHLSMIRQQHADFESIVAADETGDSKLNSWVNGLPYGEAVKYVEVMQQGTAEDVVNMLNAYKQSQSTAGNNRQSQREAAATIPRGQTAKTGTRPPSKDDFEGTWESIT